MTAEPEEVEPVDLDALDELQETITRIATGVRLTKGRYPIDEAIKARRLYAELPARRRWITRAPAGWYEPYPPPWRRSR